MAKNRESAKNSRNRKKVYFEMLEAKVVELNEELKIANQTIKQLTESLKQLGCHKLLVKKNVLTAGRLWPLKIVNRRCGATIHSAGSCQQYRISNLSSSGLLLIFTQARFAFCCIDRSYQIEIY